MLKNPTAKFWLASLKLFIDFENSVKKISDTLVLNMVHILKCADDPSRKAAHGWHILTE
jgi:hypothetical protein